MSSGGMLRAFGVVLRLLIALIATSDNLLICCILALVRVHTLQLQAPLRTHTDLPPTPTKSPHPITGPNLHHHHHQHLRPMEFSKLSNAAKTAEWPRRFPPGFVPPQSMHWPIPTPPWRVTTKRDYTPPDALLITFRCCLFVLESPGGGELKHSLELTGLVSSCRDCRGYLKLLKAFRGAARAPESIGETGNFIRGMGRMG